MSETLLRQVETNGGQQSPGAVGELSRTIDETVSALASFDADKLESLREHLRSITAEYLARELAEGRDAVPQLLRKHTLLGEMLNATAANLKVVAAVLNARRLRLNETFEETIHDRSNLVPWPL
jgi:hypothetical protein